jgi:hemolysin activation/secretion protein
MKNFKKYLLVALFTLTETLSCQAVIPPANVDPGIIDNSNKDKFEFIKRNKPQNNTNTEIDIKTAPQESPAVDRSISISINQIKFNGNTVYSDEQLQSFCSDLIGKRITFEEIRKTTELITSFYRENGYLTSFAYLPPQTIEEGIIEIRIFEGKIGNINISGNKRTKTSYIKNRIFEENNIETKNIFNINNLKKSAEQINTNPHLKSKITILQGKASETTDIIVNIKELLPLGLSVDWDNSGRDLIGNQKAGITTTLYNITGYGDDIYANTNLGSRNLGLNTGYSIPVNKKGTELKLGYSLSKVNLGGLYKDDNIHGTSYNFDISLLQPLYKNERVIVNSFLTWDMRHSITTMGSSNQTYKNYELRVLRAGLNSALFDNYGRWSSSLITSAGLPVWGAKDNDNYGEGSSKFVKINANISRIHRLPFDTTGIIKLSSQFTNTPLQTAEQYQVGGVHSVRGFEEGLILGDNGYTASVELRHNLPFLPEKLSIPLSKERNLKLPLKNRIQIAGFYDQGYTRGLQQGRNEHYTDFLQSIGWGFRVNIIKFINASVDFGIPVGKQRYEDQKSIFCHFYLSADIF